MLGLIIVLLIVGLIAGAVARLVVPGPDPIGIGGTIVIGVVGSFVGGFLGYVLFHHDANQGALQPSGIFGSIVGAVVVLLIYRAISGRNHSRRGFWRTRRTW
ncbi:MAG TPA: GlsB/YeaQ/YmgE family stress response membrane protein [Jatrophihabitans sp.]|nr:GlsB/YeaQ/YmgE family stress response membrane protein [Jatrophihabitans sp.]